MIDVVSTHAPMTWQQQWGGNFFGIAFALFMLWVFVEGTFPVRRSDAEGDDA